MFNPLIDYNEKEKIDKEDRLRRKYGFSDSRANEALEITDKFLIKRVKGVGLENIKNLKVRKHFQDKIEFHEKFDNEIIHNWREFYKFA